jgi:hypothetical protein
MARTILLTFDDNDAAEVFVEGVLDAQDTDREHEFFGHQAMAIGAVVASMSKIEAMVARPTVSCRCNIVGYTTWQRYHGRKTGGKFVDYSDRADYSASMGVWRKTERFGWLIHTKCKRPNYFVVHRFIQNMLIGIGCNNLLPEIEERLAQEKSYLEDRDETGREERREEDASTEHEPTTNGDVVVRDQPDQEVPVQPAEPSGPESSHDDSLVRD